MAQRRNFNDSLTPRNTGRHWYEIDTANPTFMADAPCAQVDPEIFFPSAGDSSAAARRVCASCPVMAQCLDWAIERRIDHGIWGGQNSLQRRRTRAAREKLEQVA